MYALERGLNMRWLGLIFAFFGGFASFGIGCATQVNAIATVCNENLHIPPAAIGIAVAVLTALVIFGGIKSIANVCAVSYTHLDVYKRQASCCLHPHLHIFVPEIQ